MGRGVWNLGNIPPEIHVSPHKQAINKSGTWRVHLGIILRIQAH